MPKVKKISKTTLQFVDIAARLIGAFSFLSILYYIDTPTPKTVIQPQSESISTDEYSLWPTALTIIAIAIITATLTFKKSIISRVFKRKIYQTPTTQASTEQKSNNFSIKTAFSKGSSELNLELLRKIEWRRFEHVCETIFKELGLRTETIPFGADGGIDIKIYNEDSTHPDAIVQCKAWNNRQAGVKKM